MTADPPDRLFDPGLQPERTVLAWQRTALTLSVGAVAIGRVLLPVIGIASYALTFLGLVIVSLLWTEAGRRYRALNHALLSPVPAAPPGLGRLALLCASACLLLGLSALAFLLSRYLLL
ncbi:DUF202 domain-containing protein [Psychromicrobium sp. YIM B11713]|uniref:DUF202 domain-containing protein n=1 Tax=Psychromicrobium sp. YIM B11713 TaxID=3145233 RepID=UPI00374E5F89